MNENSRKKSVANRHALEVKNVVSRSLLWKRELCGNLCWRITYNFLVHL